MKRITLGLDSHIPAATLASSKTCQPGAVFKTMFPNQYLCPM